MHAGLCLRLLARRRCGSGRCGTSTAARYDVCSGARPGIVPYSDGRPRIRKRFGRQEDLKGLHPAWRLRRCLRPRPDQQLRQALHETAFRPSRSAIVVGEEG